MSVPSFGRRADPIRVDDDTPVFVISVAAGLAGMHAQTLRQYDRLGLVRPVRTQGGGRRYSARDVALLREVQRLSQEGVSLPGIARILQLEAEANALRDRVEELSALVAPGAPGGPRRTGRFFAVSSSGDAVVLRPGQRPRGSERSLVLWRPTLP